MKILPDEVESISVIGTMKQKPVKLVRLIGGFHLAVGAKDDTDALQTLATGSHPGIVRYHLTKMFPHDYQETLQKAEGEVDGQVDNFPLPSRLTENGVSLCSLTKSENVTFSLSKAGIDLCSVDCNLSNSTLAVRSCRTNLDRQNPILQELLENALVTYAQNYGLKKVTKLG